MSECLLSTERRLSGSFIGREASVLLEGLRSNSSLAGRLEDLRGRSVLVATHSQLTAALALSELDGTARRIVLCPPDLPRDLLPRVAKTAEADAIVFDGSAPDAEISGIDVAVRCAPSLAPIDRTRVASHETEWILLTSGTTGMPKMAVHTLATLTGAAKSDRKVEDSVVWSTFYDIRRYGGLQIFLRAILDDASLVLSSADEPVAEFLRRAAYSGVTHISGTPSHWRRALMSPAAREISPRYVRLSGEIVDQVILDSLRAFYPGASIVHAFASTEAGVGFDVRDGLAGFPASFIADRVGDVAMKVEDGSLRIRSSRNAARYLGADAEPLVSDDGFVDTRDMVELRGDRYYFVGRRDGIINVGGLKVHPEEVEAVINRHPGVQMSLVHARKSPITGALVVADVVIKSDSSEDGIQRLKSDILDECRRALAPYKVPAMVRIVPSLEVALSGKLARL